MATFQGWNTFANPLSAVWYPQAGGTVGVGTGGGGNLSNRQLLDQAIDASRSQAAAAVGTASDYANKAMGAGQSGVQAILAERGAIDSAVADMRRQADAANAGYDDAYAAAAAMTPYIQGMAGDADRLRGVADEMRPYADKLGGYGDALWESGTKVTEQALETLGTGIGFIRMDSSASPLVAEALRLYGEFDPDKYVASASQDVQSQFDNSRGQTERALARQGVNPSSGAYAALQSARDRMLAVARSAAMTRAREQGLKDQAGMFQSLIANNALSFLDRGGELARIGQSGQAAAVDAQGKAVGALGNVGDLYGKAGSLLGDAGRLQGTQGDLYRGVAAGRAGVADIYRGAAGLDLDYGKSLAGAWDNLAGIGINAGKLVSGAQLGQAGNTLDSERLRVSAGNGGGGGGRGGGVGGVRIIDNTNKAIQARLAAGMNPIAS